MPGKYVTRLNDSQFSFVITPTAFHDFLDHNNLETKLSHVLGSIHADNKDSVKNALKAVESLIMNSDIPKNLANEVLLEYKKFGGILEGTEVEVSLLKDKDSHRVKGDAALLHKIKEKWSPSFSS